MNKIDIQLKKIRWEKRIGLMTHVVIGYPTLEATEKIVKTMAQNGVDFIELQIPFSDPLADGPTIMRACEKSLANGTKVHDAFEMMQSLSSQIDIPLLFMGYYNTVFKYGVEKFCKDAEQAGASGLIIPDMAIDEEDEEHFMFYCKKYNLYNIHVLSPVSTEERLKKNAKVANGFVYCTARQGTTGARDQLAIELSLYIEKVKKYFPLPIAVGFGISKKQHLEALSSYANIVVVGSAIIDTIRQSTNENYEKDVADFLNNLKS